MTRQPRRTTDRHVSSRRPPQPTPQRGPRTNTRPPQNRSQTTRNTASRAPIPITVWAPDNAALDPTTPWPAPLLTQLLDALTEPADTVVLLPVPGSADHHRDQAIEAAAELVRNHGRRASSVLLDQPATPDTRRVSAGVLSEQTAPAESEQPALPTPDGDHTWPPAAEADLVVTHLAPEAAEAPVVEHLAATARCLLTPGGIFAVLTHSDRTEGVLRDPSGLVVASGQHAGLRYLQHLVLLLAPIHQGQLSPPDPDGTSEDATRAARHARAHADALLLVQPARGS